MPRVSFSLQLVVVLAAAFAVAPQRASADQKLTAGDDWQEFGASVALGSSAAVIGAPAHSEDPGDGRGAAYVFARDENGFATTPQKLLPTPGGPNYLFGWCVALDGDTAVVGAHCDSGAGECSGAVYVYVRSGSSWELQQKLTASDAAAGQMFGWSVAISGNTLAVGAIGDATHGAESGTAYVFVRNGTSWSEQQKLSPSGLVAHSKAGVSVAVLNDNLVLGANGDTDNGVGAGTVYAFTRSGVKWTQRQQILAASGSTNDDFGYTVVLAPGLLAIGADLDDERGTNAGAVHVYRLSGSSWVLQTKLLGEIAGDQFGYSVALRDGQLMVGAVDSDLAGTDAGAVYRYTVNAASSTFQDRLAAPDASIESGFGSAVAVQAGLALVGAFTDTTTSAGGSAYSIAIPAAPASAPALGTGFLFCLACALVLAGTRRRGAAALCALLATGCSENAPSPQPTAAVAALTQDTLTFTAARDATIRSSAPDSNFGTNPILDLNRTLLAFDATAIKAGIGPNDYVVSASLELTLQRNTSRRTPTTVSAYRLTSNWTEAGVTWECATDSDPPDNQKDCSGGMAWSMDTGTNPWAMPASAQASVQPLVQGTIKIDLSNDVRSFVAGQTTHYGWMLRGSGVAEFDEFTSRESSTPPRLVLTVRRCAPAQCDDGNACTADSCDAQAQCAHAPVTNGTDCSDGNACTQHDTCQAGSCTAGTSVTCVASDACHAAGSCDPSSGTCSNPNAPDDTSCGDGNACTQNDRCLAGVCTGGTPVVCTALDQCHLPGECDPASGACSNPTASDATPCTDGNACSLSDQCVAGVCTGMGAVVCGASDQCHAPGMCDPTSGLCSNPSVADATSCDDGNACTRSDQCLAGACTGSDPVACSASDQCHGAGTCDPLTGSCSNPTLADATACNDGNACTGGDQCMNGVCNGQTPVVCPAIDGCHTAGACEAASGTCSQTFIAGCRILSGVVAGSLFTPATASVRASSAPSTYAGVKVCIDENADLACNDGENSAQTGADGHFALYGAQQGAVIAEVSTSAQNQGQTVAQRVVFRAPLEQVAESFEDAGEDPRAHYFVVVSPLSTEVARMMADDALTYSAAKNHLAVRLGLAEDALLDDPATLSPASAQKAWVTESTVLTNRFGLAAKMVDRGDVSPAALAMNPGATGPAIDMREAHSACMNLEGIPRYDNIFMIVLENREAVTIKNNTFAPNINAYLNSGNQFGSYYATGNPSEPNRVAMAAGDDFGITDDSAWNCVDKAANNPEDPLPAGMSTCSNATNHNIKNRRNLLNAMTAGGMTWRVYSETINPGRDFRRDGAADSTLKAPDHIYDASSPVGARGNPNLMVTLPSGAYATKHNESVNFQNVRSAPEFFDSNRTMGGGQWDDAIRNSPSTPAGWDVDQLGTDLGSGDLANLNYLEPDQCDDMHGLTVTGPITGGGTGTASDCSGNPLIYRSDLYTDYLIKKIKASSLWANPYKRVAIVIMFDEGTVTTGTFSCCGWNPGGKATGIVIKNPDGTSGQDTSVANYKNGNKGHSYSVFGVLNNQAAAPKGLYDSDAYSHIAFVRTLQDMFQLADPGDNWSYMNRSKYTQSFIAANLMFLPEYAGSADPHFDAVRAMNHSYVIPAGYTQKNGYPTSAAKQVGPDATQINLWSLKP